MRCRECGLELDERDLLRNGAYQCPECGTIHHTASSRRGSPSPYRRKRRSALQVEDGILTRKLWLLPIWSWIAIALVVLVALILLLTLGGRTSEPANPDMPAVEDTPRIEDQETPDEDAQGDSQLTDSEQALITQMESTPVTQAGRTGVLANDFIVSYEWAMSYLNHNSTMTQVSEETDANGDLVRTYNYEGWLDVVMTIDPASTGIRSLVATAANDGSEEATTRMTQAFVCTLYGIDNTLTPNTANAEITSMLADEAYAYTKTAFTAKLTQNDSSGYRLEITGKG